MAGVLGGKSANLDFYTMFRSTRRNVGTSGSAKEKIRPKNLACYNTLIILTINNAEVSRREKLGE